MVVHDGNSAGVESISTSYNAPNSDMPRWNPPRKVWGFILLALLIIVTVRITNLTGDHAVDNIITTGFTFLALFAWIGWFGFYSGHTIWIRVLPILFFILFSTIFFVFYRIDHVSGELVPVFARRFSSHPDQLLPLPVRTTTPDATNTPNLNRKTPNDFPQFLGPSRNSCSRPK